MNKRYVLLGFVAQYYWFTFLLKSESYYAPYLFVGILGIVCAVSNLKGKVEVLEKREKILAIIGSVMFSVIVIIANYSLFLNLPCPDGAGAAFIKIYKVLSCLLVFAGGCFIAWNILNFGCFKLKDFSWKKEKHTLSPKWFFILSLVLLSSLNLAWLFLAKYPGNISPDSLNQMRQIITGKWNNHHPFYHTLLIKIFISVGLNLFGEINAAVSLYHVFQIVFMAASFSYVLVTLYQMNVSGKLICLCGIYYIASPFHIMYSFTMWKDIIFGGTVCLFITAIYRIQKSIGKVIFLNYLLAVLGSIGICLFRSNGWFSYLLTVLFFIWMFRKRYKSLCAAFIGVLIITFILKHPVLEALHVTPPHAIESLAIPAQQIARTVTDCDDLSEKQRRVLNEVIDVDAIPTTYQPHISDPIKRLVRERGNSESFSKHKGELLKLYAELAFAHPFKYIEAWIDSTVGYWNGGYAVDRWVDGVGTNGVSNLGIVRTVKWNFADKLLNGYLWLFENVEVLKLFLSIGFHVWIIMFLGFIDLIRKDKQAGFMIVPVATIILSLMVATPLFATLRYVYAMFCIIPFLILGTFYKGESAG